MSECLPGEDGSLASLPASWLPLLRESLAQQGAFRWQLSGRSMEPTLPDGCEILIAPLAGRTPLGTLIVFASGPTLVAHRLVHRRGVYLVAQGDGRREPDRWLTPGQVVGQVVSARRAGRLIWPRRGERLARWRWIGRAHALAGLRRLRRLTPLAGRDGPA